MIDIGLTLIVNVACAGGLTLRFPGGVEIFKQGMEGKNSAKLKL